MKKTLLLLLCTTMLGLVSCKKDTIIQETPNRTFVYTVQPSQWVLSTDQLTYSVELDVPEFDRISVDDEGTLVYIANPANANTYKQLPLTYNTDTYSYEMYEGGLAIDIQSSDFQDRTPFAPQNAVQIKVVLIPSQFVE